MPGLLPVVDFVGGAVGHRHRFGGGRGQPLPRAAGFAKGQTPSIIDATAGLGRDAFLLASLGAQVTLIERSPTMQGLLAAGLARALEAGGETAAAAGRMTLLPGDARDLLGKLSADVVVVDPMHPERTSSALVKQDMRLLRDLVGADPDALELMTAALAAAGKRVVLKWPLRAEPMPGLRAASHQILSKTLRYDVFMV
jgi:16S rRNA (guanine1516-N2)-methyltransferase